MKNRTVLYHVLFWVAVYALWIIIFHRYSVAITKTMTIEFCYLIFITADYYGINNIIVPGFLSKAKYVSFVIATVAIIAVSAGLRACLAWQMNATVFHGSQPMDFATLYVNSAVNISIWVLLITVGKMLAERMYIQRKMKVLEGERLKSELDFLKAQVNPHALFNSLNTIYGHIDKNNQAARNILLQFSELLRYQLYDCGAEKVSLDKEMSYIKNYVTFQRLRKNENLVVAFETDIENPTLTIAPLLLIVLIENAFKFVSTFSEHENKITIRIGTHGKYLKGAFINTKDIRRMDNNGSGSIGLVNLTRRLELLYPGKYEMNTTDEADLYKTTLTIDLS